MVGDKKFSFFLNLLTGGISIFESLDYVQDRFCGDANSSIDI